MANKYKPFFVTDADGKLFKATPVKDDDFNIEEEEDKKITKQAMPNDEDVSLSKEEIAALKEIAAEHIASKKAEEHPAEEDVHDEEEQEEIDEDIKKEQVVDTCAKDSVKKGFGSVQKKKTNVINDEDNSIEVDNAWKNRYK